MNGSLVLEKAKSARTVPKVITATRGGKTYRTVTWVLANPPKGRADAGNLGLDFGEDYLRQVSESEKARVTARWKADVKVLKNHYRQRLQSVRAGDEVSRARIAGRLDKAMERLGRVFANRLRELDRLPGPEPALVVPLSPARVLMSRKLQLSHAADPVQRVREMVAGGVSTVGDCLTVGEVIYNSVIGEPTEAMKRYRATHSRLLANLREVHRLREELANPSHPRTREESRSLAMRLENLTEAQRPLNADFSLCSKQGIAGVRTVGGRVVSFLEKVRPMGLTPGSGASELVIAGTGQKDALFEDALSVVPRSWIACLKPVRLHESSQGASWKESSRTISANWDGQGTERDAETRAHLAGHAVESDNPKLAALCRKFLLNYRGTEFRGRPVGTPGPAAEVGALSPDLPLSRCGVVYPNGTTEMLSTALGALRSDPSLLLSLGPKYWKFIFGLMAGARGG